MISAEASRENAKNAAGQEPGGMENWARKPPPASLCQLFFLKASARRPMPFLALNPPLTATECL